MPRVEQDGGETIGLEQNSRPGWYECQQQPWWINCWQGINLASFITQRREGPQQWLTLSSLPCWLVGARLQWKESTGKRCSLAHSLYTKAYTGDWYLCVSTCSLVWGTNMCAHFSKGLHQRRCWPGVRTHTASPREDIFIGGPIAKIRPFGEKKSLPYPQEIHPTLSIWNSMRPNPPISVKIRMRGNFLKKHPPALSCHR